MRVRMTKEEIKRILSANKEVLKRYKVESIALFGSYVRNEQREDSDIDLLVELKEPTYDNFINLVFSLEELFGKDVNLILEGGLSPYIEPYVKKEAERIET
ncbi:MAG: nucleotidyltransferase family protein [Candidatus Eisenbacteria bacterium]|nr:nucleotidyltransferase family protein [Candidatus Eisenbacteria bacterium]